jgi:protein unc-13
VTLNQPSQRNAVAAEADEVLRPLMDLLDGQLLYCLCDSLYDTN